MTTEAAQPSSFDPFGIEHPKSSSSAAAAAAKQKDVRSTRRSVLMAVDDGNNSISHHSQLYSERHSSYSSPDAPSNPKAGRFHSSKQQQQNLISKTKSETSMESVDPFGIGVSGDASLQPQSLEQRLEAARNGESPRIVLDPKTGQPARSSSSLRNAGGGKAFSLPPKMSIKLTLYEEVSSMSLRQDLVTASQIAVEGSCYAQIACSDARKNAPFGICATTTTQHPSNASSASTASGASTTPQVTIRPNPKYTALEPENKNSSAKQQQNKNNQLDQTYMVQVPKSELGFVPIVHYSFSQVVDHMPVLLERKVTIHERSCRIALQVRSKLTNRGDLRDFTLAVAVPELVDGDSIEVLRGNGSYNTMTRLIKFQLEALNKGESFMVSAQCKLWKARVTSDDVRFPVLMRCSSTDDQISNVDFQVQTADGSPCSISVTKAHSFRLLHRLT